MCVHKCKNIFLIYTHIWIYVRPWWLGVRNPSAMQKMQEMWVRSLGRATQSSIIAWEIPWTEEPGRLQLMGHKQLDTTE